jgi:DNA-directed RNA polymerase specialized sigma24 family protein
LQRLVLQEVRRRRRANGRMVFVGSSDELPPTPVRNPQIQIDCALDLEIILQGEHPDVRLALLLRYSRLRWSEIAAALGTTEAAVRLRCKRAIERIRVKQEGEQHES